MNGPEKLQSNGPSKENMYYACFYFFPESAIDVATSHASIRQSVFDSFAGFVGYCRESLGKLLFSFHIKSLPYRSPLYQAAGLRSLLATKTVLRSTDTDAPPLVAAVEQKCRTPPIHDLNVCLSLCSLQSLAS